MTSLVLLSLVASATLVSSSPPKPYQEKYFDQKLDHFNYAYYKNSTYKQRYLIQDDSWDAGGLKGPIFFYTGNEGGIEGFYNNCGFIMEIAQQFRGENQDSGRALFFLSPGGRFRREHMRSRHLLCTSASRSAPHLSPSG